MSNIRVKGGNINYEIVKDLSVDDQMSRIQFYINQILSMESKDKLFVKYQLVNLFKDYLFIDVDIMYNDDDTIDHYFLKLIVYLNKILSNNSVQFHVNRLKSELNLNEDIKSALNKLYASESSKKSTNLISSRLIRGVFSPIKSENYMNKRSCDQFFNIVTTKSNPDFNLNHNITLFVGKKQFNKYIIKNIECVNRDTKKAIKTSNNIYENSKIESIIQTKLNGKILDKTSGINTCEHIYNNNRCGIYVNIFHNRVVMFAPFVNDEYENDWSSIEFDSPDKTMDTYYKNKQKLYRKEEVIKDIGKWWNNGHIISNEYTDNYWSDYGFLQLRNMFDELCANKIVADCEFIINKRDCVVGYSNDNSIPILSFYSNNDSSDINIPLAEDWELACQMVFPKGNNKIYACSKDISDSNFIKHKVNWDKKIEIALFRGSATGKGITVDTNQRLNLVKSFEKNNLIDAKITSWNMRDKVISGDLHDKNNPALISYIKHNEINIDVGKHNFIPMMDQLKYKYLIYVDGHSASNRYSFMMKTGSVILKVDPLEGVAGDMWYSKLLKPYVDHVPVKADLSDLDEKIKWCIDNDDKCKLIASNAYKLYNKIITKGSIMDYLQLLCYNISTKYEDKFCTDSYLDIKYSFEIDMAKYKTEPLLRNTNVLDNVDIPELPNLKLSILENTEDDINKLLIKKNEIDKILIPYLSEYTESMKQLINNIYQYLNDK